MGFVGRRRCRLATIKDVARLAGVSITTVSATINDRPVSEELRKRVWAAIDEAGYQPDPIARHLRSGVSTTVGLIVPDIATPWAAHLAKSMQRALSERGYNMLFASNDDDPEREAKEIELLMAHRVAGLVIAPTSQGENYLERLRQRVRTPTVMVDRVLRDAPFDAVTDDNLLGAQLLTRFLLKLGHRDIAFLVGRQGISPSDERFEGFGETMREAGVGIRDDLVRQPVYRYEHAYSAVQQLMMLSRPPTAILTINIAQLLGTMAGLKNMGLRVPDDVSVASFDGFHPAEGWFPSITTLMQDVAGVTAKASEYLLERIDRSVERPRIVRVPPSLQIRESCRELV